MSLQADSNNISINNKNVSLNSKDLDGNSSELMNDKLIPPKGKPIKIEEENIDGFKCIREIQYKLEQELWFKDGLLNSYNDKPAVIKYYSYDHFLDDYGACEEGLVSWYEKCDEFKVEIWFKNGMEHRDEEKGPAVIIYDFTEQKICEIWMNNGNKHRNMDLPSLITYHRKNKISMKKWFKNDNLYKRTLFII